MEILEGLVEAIIFKSDDSGYIVAKVTANKEVITIVGIMPLIKEGQQIEIKGNWINHKQFGRQFSVEEYKELLPTSAKEIEKYLPVDYSDSFSIEVTENRLSPKDIILKVFAHNPAWLRMLYAIRACLVKPFGIETKAIESEELIIEEDKQEAIMRKDDKHLLFYVDIFITPLETGKQMIEVTTLVKYHNWVGKAYFFCIKPFHRVIVPLVLKKALC